MLSVDVLFPRYVVFFMGVKHFNNIDIKYVIKFITMRAGIKSTCTNTYIVPYIREMTYDFVFSYRILHFVRCTSLNIRIIRR